MKKQAPFEQRFRNIQPLQESQHIIYTAGIGIINSAVDVEKGRCRITENGCFPAPIAGT